jgi:hypothetical protein
MSNGPSSPRDSALSTSVEVHDSGEPAAVILDIKSQDTSASMTPVRRIVELFATSANAGMFPAKHTSPEETALTVAAETNESGRLQQRWSVRGLGPGAYKVFLSLLGVVHQYESPLASITLRSMNGRGRIVNLKEIIEYPYPQRAEIIEFVLRLPRIRDEFGSPRIRIEFVDDVVDDHLDRLTEWFTAWDHLITHGGYYHVADGLELDDEVNFGETYMLSANTVEHTFESVVGGAGAFDALINMTVRIHRTVHRVAAFELE